jgi:hypothetical protein
MAKKNAGENAKILELRESETAKIESDETRARKRRNSAGEYSHRVVSPLKSRKPRKMTVAEDKVSVKSTQKPGNLARKRDEIRKSGNKNEKSKIEKSWCAILMLRPDDMNKTSLILPARRQSRPACRNGEASHNFFLQNTSSTIRNSMQHNFPPLLPRAHSGL